MHKEKSLVKNYIFNLLKTVCTILFPVISFSYSAHILGADGIGKVNFAKSIVTYFIMFSMLGINYYGTREAAKLKDDEKELSKFCLEMLIINGCTTLLAYLLLAISISTIPQIHSYKILLLVCSGAILLQGMGMEWLYQAMEEYRYIAIRSALFQICALIAMFIFVRDENDIVQYAVITVGASSGSYIFNFINARKYIHIKQVNQIEILKHLKPLLWLFAMAISIELYTVLDTTMLGLLKGDNAVGLYTAAIKVERIVNTLITSLGVVLIPRLSFYIGHGEYDKTNRLIKKAYNYVFILSIPAAIGLFMLSDDIILMFSGKEFVTAGLTMRILTPIVILIPFSMMTNQQIFIPMRKEKLILLSTTVGAIVNFTLNMLLIPLYAENGAAMATVIAEFAVALVCFINGNIQFNVGRSIRPCYQYWIAASIIPLVYVLSSYLFENILIKSVITVSISIVGYISILLVIKNQYIKEAISVFLGSFLSNRHMDSNHLDF